MTEPHKPKQRIAYLDWMRGFACLVMFQTHCYDSWLSTDARNTRFFHLSQLGGSLPAPLFLFLAGIATALVTDHSRQKGVADSKIARKCILRGAEILGYGLLFRVQEYLLGLPWAPWTDLLRVDVLNVIGVSLMLCGVICRLAALGVPSADGAELSQRNARLERRTIVFASVAAAAVVLLTPLVWTTHRLSWLPWYLESYLNGVHIYGTPQPWLFPIFPWTAFALVGLAVGFVLVGAWAARDQLSFVLAAGTAGIFLIALGHGLDASPVRLYAVYDFWHTSPNFFLIRVGVLLVIVLASYVWCRWGAGERGFSPLIELGRASLLVYWVHIEFVYGRFSILAKQAQSITNATIGLLAIFAAMVMLAFARNRINLGALRRSVFEPRRAPESSL